MSMVPFFKYTSFGNNFVIVDETEDTILSEQHKSLFAFHATNKNYGIGSDNFLVIQRCTSEILSEIGNKRGYWHNLPETDGAAFIFRMFEPDGTEAFSCGNGLLCMALHLNEHYGITSTRILTELPTGTPSAVTVGKNLKEMLCWTNLGCSRPVPQQIVKAPPAEQYDTVIKKISGLQITFRKHDLTPISDEQVLTVSGYLVFTGEPHMVIFPDEGFSIRDLGDTMFLQPHANEGDTGHIEKRSALGTWLIHHISSYINKNYSDVFPSGININFVHLNNTRNVLDYRCYERGINRETLACGTGAIAVCAVAGQLGLTSKDTVSVRPHRCRWKDPDAEMVVMKGHNGWLLNGTPKKLVKGEFYFDFQYSGTITGHASERKTGIKAAAGNKEGRGQPACLK